VFLPQISTSDEKGVRMEMHHHLTTAIMLTAAYHQGLQGGHWTVRMPAVAEPAPRRAAVGVASGEAATVDRERSNAHREC
jgi:hypothetical protein